jgi:hypothetical protein
MRAASCVLVDTPNLLNTAHMWYSTVLTLMMCQRHRAAISASALLLALAALGGLLVHLLVPARTRTWIVHRRPCEARMAE